MLIGRGGNTEIAPHLRRCGRQIPPIVNPACRIVRNFRTSRCAKNPVSIRLSPDVLDHYRSSGRGWQGRIDEALRKSIQL
ncbi:BrnA antitoxin family protein [Phyllobacterium zundukense]|uniref:BrnA antitoxin family protein n=1 Tax=Phyllobacterium zundukense TaxID=1867719 RepID=UPI003965BFE2